MNFGLKAQTLMGWVRMAEKGKSPIDTLKDRGIERIIVYGIAELGCKLVQDAIERDYPVAAITDKKIKYGNYTYENIPVVKLDDIKTMESQNSIIVVTPMNFWWDIRRDLLEHGCKNFIALRDLIDF